METPENHEDKLPLEDTEDVRSNHESLVQFVISILILIVVISGTLNILLLRLWKNSSNDVKLLRPQYEGLVALYQKNDAGPIEKITQTFQAFGATNPDYVPILAKYGLKPAPAPAAPVPGATKK